MVILPSRSEVEISRAIRECAKLCLNHNVAPIKCIDDFAKGLIAKGWQEADLAQFKRGTLYVLAYLRKSDALFPETKLENQE